MSTGSKILKYLRGPGILLFWIGVWWLLALAVGKDVLIPGPDRVAVKLAELLTVPDFYKSVGLSIARILLGFSAATLAGAVLGVLCAKVRWVDMFLSPLLSVIKATPVASFIILALVLINKEILPAAISFLMVLPVIHGNVRQGVLETDGKLLEMMRFFGASRKDILTKLYVPQVFPYFLSGVRTCLGLAWKAGVAAEVLCYPKYSVGTNLYQSKVYLETESLFAWTVVIIVISMVIEKILMRLIEYAVARRREVKSRD